MKTSVGKESSGPWQTKNIGITTLCNHCTNTFIILHQLHHSLVCCVLQQKTTAGGRCAGFDTASRQDLSFVRLCACKAAQSQDNSWLSELDSLDSLCRRAGAPMAAETSPCNVDAAFSGAFQGDGSTAITPVAFDFADHEVRRWKESHPRRCT